MDLYLRRLLRWFWVAILLIGATIAVYDVCAQMREMEVLRQEITLENEAADKVDKAELDRIMRDLQAEHAEISASMVVFNAAVSSLQEKVNTEKNVALLTQEIVKIAEHQFVELSLVKPIAQRVAGDYEILPVITQLSSSYEGLFMFLDAIETSALLSGVESFSIRYNPSASLPFEVALTVFAIFRASSVAPEPGGAGAL